MLKCEKAGPGYFGNLVIYARIHEQMHAAKTFNIHIHLYTQIDWEKYTCNGLMDSALMW